jgi:hypothetical protein
MFCQQFSRSGAILQVGRPYHHQGTGPKASTSSWRLRALIGLPAS